jgi:hypothetical protein
MSLQTIDEAQPSIYINESETYSTAGQNWLDDNFPAVIDVRNPVPRQGSGAFRFRQSSDPTSVSFWILNHHPMQIISILIPICHKTTSILLVCMI